MKNCYDYSCIMTHGSKSDNVRNMIRERQENWQTRKKSLSAGKSATPHKCRYKLPISSTNESEMHMQSELSMHVFNSQKPETFEENLMAKRHMLRIDRSVAARNDKLANGFQEQLPKSCGIVEDPIRERYPYA